MIPASCPKTLIWLFLHYLDHLPIKKGINGGSQIPIESGKEPCDVSIRVLAACNSFEVFNYVDLTEIHFFFFEVIFLMIFRLKSLKIFYNN